MFLIPACRRTPAVEISPNIAVLCYHTFDSPKITNYTLDTRKFREQLRYLKVQHIPVIPLARLVDHLKIGAPLPPQSVVITIDDGYRTARTKAWPILREFDDPFTLFVYPQAVSRHGSALTWEDVKVMSDAGVDIQSHSMTHPLLTHPGHAMTRAAYDAWLDHELADSRKILADHTGKPVSALAYPFGAYDEHVVERTKQAGYDSAYTCDSGVAVRGVDLLHINRFVILHWIKSRSFANYVNGRPLLVDQLSPRDGERLKAAPSEVSAHIRNLGDIQPGSLSIIVDQVGPKLVPIQPDAQGVIRFPVPARVKGGFFFASLGARDRVNPGLHREATWLFISPKKKSKIQSKQHS